jgi:hypothetical protein
MCVPNRFTSDPFISTRSGLVAGCGAVVVFQNKPKEILESSYGAEFPGRSQRPRASSANRVRNRLGSDAHASRFGRLFRTVNPPLPHPK